MNKMIYICHQFGGKSENKEKVESLIRQFVKDYPDYTFISPIHSFGFLYHDVSWEDGLIYCLDLLNKCDEMWTFGKYSNTKGCMREKLFCDEYYIPIVEKGDY